VLLRAVLFFRVPELFFFAVLRLRVPPVELLRVDLVELLRVLVRFLLPSSSVPVSSSNMYSS
jgi:hypothetical protein